MGPSEWHLGTATGYESDSDCRIVRNEARYTTTSGSRSCDRLATKVARPSLKRGSPILVACVDSNWLLRLGLADHDMRIGNPGVRTPRTLAGIAFDLVPLTNARIPCLRSVSEGARPMRST